MQPDSARCHRTEAVPVPSISCLALLACSCAPLPRTEPDECSLASGALVITEIMANPEGADAGREWFEIHNAESETVSVRGIILEKSRADGSGQKLWPITVDDEIPPDGFFVVGDVPEDASEFDHVDYGYADELTSLPNRDGYLAIRCGATVLDEVAYDDVPTGAAWSLDAGALDANANDTMTNWCAVESRGAGVAGTPGAPNPLCDDVAWRLPCLDDGNLREPVLPVAGDVLISEVLANPAAVSDDRGEFLEVYVANAVDLNGLEVWRDPSAESPAFVLDAAECLRMDAGAYVVLAAAADENGGVSADFLLGATLPNGEGIISIFAGGVLLDQVAHGAATAGVSYGRDLSDPDAPSGEPSWCLATSEYGAGDLGTPGLPNDPCGVDEPDPLCTTSGVARPIDTPRVGDLVITELMQDPSAVQDASGEWFEVCATRGVDLNGLEIGKDGEVVDVLVDEGCLRVESGACVVFGRLLDQSANGGVPVDFQSTVPLINRTGNLFLAHAGAVLDEVAWGQSTPGVSASFHGDPLSSTTNDDVDSWCAGTVPWPESDGDRGSPGSPNPACEGDAADGTCLDGGSIRSLMVPGPGDLVISEVMPNPEGADATEEWIELFALTDFDLAAIVIGADAAPTDHPVDPDAPGDCLFVAAGSHVVLARSADASVAFSAVWSRMALSNGTQDGVWVGAGGVVIDSLVWSGAGEGQSLCRLSPTRAAWGTDDDGGTPGAENTTCVGP